MIYLAALTQMINNFDRFDAKWMNNGKLGEFWAMWTQGFKIFVEVNFSDNRMHQCFLI